MIKSSTPAAICIQAYLQVCSFHPAVASTFCPLSSTVSAKTSSCQFSQLLCSLAALLQLHLHLRNPRRMKQILRCVIHHQWPKLFSLFPLQQNRSAYLILDLHRENKRSPQPLHFFLLSLPFGHQMTDVLHLHQLLFCVLLPSSFGSMNTIHCLGVYHLVVKLIGILLQPVDGLLLPGVPWKKGVPYCNMWASPKFALVHDKCSWTTRRCSWTIASKLSALSLSRAAHTCVSYSVPGPIMWIKHATLYTIRCQPPVHDHFPSSHTSMLL